LVTDGKLIAVKNERIIMHLLLSPVLASIIWVGGGGVGLVLVIVVVVLLLRG
jgi:cellobiose-specific phosphotransferase system component IIC